MKVVLQAQAQKFALTSPMGDEFTDRRSEDPKGVNEFLFLHSLGLILRNDNIFANRLPPFHGCYILFYTLIQN